MASGIARSLRQHGADIQTAVEADLLGASDAEQLAHARQEGRVMVTHDADFLRLHQLDPDHSGIAFCAQGSRTLGGIIRRLLMLYRLATPAEIAGRVEYL